MVHVNICLSGSWSTVIVTCQWFMYISLGVRGSTVIVKCQGTCLHMSGREGVDCTSDVLVVKVPVSLCWRWSTVIVTCQWFMSI